MGTPTGKGTTRYSPKVPGDTTNYRWPVKFDLTDGALGISQERDGGSDRVLLSPNQVRALLDFLKRRPA